MKKFLLPFLVLFIYSFIALAQKENNVWAFGKHAGLDFNSGSPVGIQTKMETTEGVATICNKNGQLLFYTDGTYIWDRNHNLLPNASTPLTGAPNAGTYTATYSTTQAALIVPMLGSKTKYYVFSLTYQLLGNPLYKGKLYYSIVDVNLNGGLGDVVAGKKGIFMDSNLTEKMAAVTGAYNNIWIMTRSHTSNQYKAFEITKAGINISPVISNIGLLPADNYGGGAICFSPNGKKMAAACENPIVANTSVPGYLELYDFDLATGIVSNVIAVDPGGNKYYGASFSPDGTKLYASLHVTGPNPGAFGINQFDVSLPTSAIPASKIRITTQDVYDIKKGPDDKIYTTNVLGTTLGVINFPNQAGAACQFLPLSVALFSGTKAMLGLPQNYMFISPPSKHDTVFYCTGGTGKLVTTRFGPYKWQVLDGPVVINGNGDTITFTATQNSRILLIDSFSNMVDTTTILVTTTPAVSIGKDTTICEDMPISIGTNETGVIYQWNTGETTAYIKVSKTNAYILTVYRNGCPATDTINIVAMPSPTPNLGDDRYICAGQTIPLDATATSGSIYKWGTGDTEPIYNAIKGGTYFVTVTSEYGCFLSDTIVLTYVAKPIVALGNDTVLCKEISLILTPSFLINEDSIMWSNGTDGHEIKIVKEGMYTITAFSKCGSVSDSILVRSVFCNVWLPDAFTPNNDGKNDIFRMLGDLGRMQDVNLNIYNRWGQLIFNTNDKYKGWDGKQNGEDAEIGTYVYLLQYSVDGASRYNKGNFQLVR